MSTNGNGEAPTVVNFDGDTYSIDSLTPRVLEGFNMLVKLQNEIAELSYQLKKSQAAQAGISNEIKVNIRTDKIKIIEENLEEIVEATQ